MRLAPYTALAKAAFKANLGRLEFPFKLTFCLTFWCNYRCETCNIWKMKPRDELRLEEIREFFKRSPGFSWVDLTGGEVWLRKDFVDICEALTTSCKNLLPPPLPDQRLPDRQGRRRRTCDHHAPRPTPREAHHHGLDRR